jgi:hypothetical protein
VVAVRGDLLPAGERVVRQRLMSELGHISSSLRVSRGLWGTVAPTP